MSQFFLSDFSELNNNNWVYDNYMIMKSLFFLTNVDMLGWFFFSQVASANSSFMQCCKKCSYITVIFYRDDCWFVELKLYLSICLFLLGTWNIFVFFQSKSQLFIFIMSSIQSFPEKRKEKMLDFFKQLLLFLGQTLAIKLKFVLWSVS